jgi:hypothetical protein
MFVAQVVADRLSNAELLPALWADRTLYRRYVVVFKVAAVGVDSGHALEVAHHLINCVFTHAAPYLIASR